MNNRILLTVLLFALWLTLSACTAKIPIPVLEYGKMDASVHQNLLILLRGRGGSHQDFEKYGIIDEVRKRNLPFDIVAPDAHFGYYMSESLHKRLKADIIDPARKKGYKNIWLAGFSMGGLGSLFYLANYPGDDIDGVILCSPFVGGRNIHNKIEDQGGIENWSIPDNDNWQYRLWGWIKDYQLHPSDYPPIFLGYSRQDSITGNGPALLATALDPQHVFVVTGGHDYPTFQTLWRTHMDRLEDRLKNLPTVESSIRQAVK